MSHAPQSTQALAHQANTQQAQSQIGVAANNSSQTLSIGTARQDNAGAAPETTHQVNQDGATHTQPHVLEADDAGVGERTYSFLGPHNPHGGPAAGAGAASSSAGPSYPEGKTYDSGYARTKFHSWDASGFCTNCGIDAATLGRCPNSKRAFTFVLKNKQTIHTTHLFKKKSMGPGMYGKVILDGRCQREGEGTCLTYWNILNSWCAGNNSRDPSPDAAEPDSEVITIE